MIFAIMQEHLRCYRIDRERYHAAMDDYWARKRRERLLNWLLPPRRSRGTWGAVRHEQKKAPARRQPCKAQRSSFKYIIAQFLM